MRGLSAPGHQREDLRRSRCPLTPDAAVRAVSGRLLLLCSLLRSSLLTVGPSDRRRRSDASPGRTGSRSRVGWRGCWRSTGAVSRAALGPIEAAANSPMELSSATCEPSLVPASGLTDSCEGRNPRSGMSEPDEAPFPALSGSRAGLTHQRVEAQTEKPSCRIGRDPIRQFEAVRSPLRRGVWAPRRTQFWQMSHEDAPL